MRRDVLAAGLLIGFAVAAVGCIDPIDLDVGPPERRLVVEATLTEGPGPHEVRLTRSGAFTQGIDALRPPERNAQVTILDGDGTETLLPEGMAGFYRSAAGQLVGEPGQSYRLRIELENGQIYESPFEAMRPAPEIADAYTELGVARVVSNGVLLELPEIALMVDAYRLATPTYYRWTWRGSFRVYTCVGLDCQTCYVETAGRSPVEIGDDLLVGGDVLAEQRVEGFRVKDHGLRFVRDYYLEVEQQSLSPEAYHFWSLIRDARDDVGGLFDPPADAAIGNVRNVEDQRDYALGYFTVAGTTRAATCSRLADFPDAPPFPTEGYLDGVCGVDIAGSTTAPPNFNAVCGAH